MGDAEAGPSHSVSYASQSILAPTSPNIFDDPPSPDPQNDVHEGSAPPELQNHQASEPQRRVSETYTNSPLENPTESLTYTDSEIYENQYRNRPHSSNASRAIAMDSVSLSSVSTVDLNQYQNYYSSSTESPVSVVGIEYINENRNSTPLGSDTPDLGNENEDRSTPVERPNRPNLDEDSNSSTSLPQVAVPKRETDDEEGPPAKIRKRSQSNDEMDGETCPICLDAWGNSGDHRLVALKCGHLFGSKCVERWLKTQPAKDRSCPTCKTKTSMKDIRHIYARKLVAADTSQITALQKQIDTLQQQKSRAELELQKSKIAHRASLMQLEVLQRTLMKSQGPKEQTVRRSWRFALEKNLEIFKEGNCRVLTYNCRTYELYVSQKSMNYLFPGFGIRKVSCVDYKIGQFVHLHPKPIRDITYSQPKDLLLSVGLDSSAKIVERGILSCTVNTGVPLWSCSWDYLRGNEFYVGGVGGVIFQYDVRNPNTYLQRLQAPGDLSPVVSLFSTEFGLLSCQLNTCWLWVTNQRQWEPKALPIEGPFMSLSYDYETHRVLISCRAGANGERSRLALFKLKASVPSGDIIVETEQSFNGSARTSVMSRATFVKVPGATWIAAHSESDSSLYLHGLDGARTINLPSYEPALDVCCVQLNGDTLVAALSESRLRLYKAVPTNL